MTSTTTLSNPYNPLARTTWHADGLRWIASVINTLADSIDREHNAPTLALEPTPEDKPIEEFLYDARFRVQHEMFLR